MSRRRASAAGLEEAAPLFAALGDETRLRLVARLCADGPASIARLDEARHCLEHISAQWDAALGRLQATLGAEGERARR